ncbi:hypothetical protein CE91St36_24890 [Christensenellaceae bacterium]|nr:hypothetical protein CE91St36_24890 [Christensenellaceae bacterium]BDF62335.1 hypothetical protein CE91St37_24850 [Christensenellaceae bacterium]
MTKKKKAFNFNRIKFFVLIGVLIYASLTFVNQQSILATQAAKQAELLSEEEELTKEIDYYENELGYIGSSDYIEKEARDRLGWVLPNETKFVEDENASASAPDSTEPAASPEPNASASPQPQETGVQE